MASADAPRRRRNMQLQDGKPCSISDSITRSDESHRRRFEQLRHDVSRLKELIFQPCQTEQENTNQSLGILQKLTQNIDTNIDKLSAFFLDGQKCNEDGIKRLEQLIRQNSRDDQLLQNLLEEERNARRRLEEDLRDERKQEKETRRKFEDESRELRKREDDNRLKIDQLVEERNQNELSRQTLEKELHDTKKKLQCAEEKMKCYLTNTAESNRMMSRRSIVPRFVRSVGCDVLPDDESFNISLSGSFISFISADESFSDISTYGVQRTSKKIESKSLPTDVSFDSAFSETLADNTEMLQELNRKVEKLLTAAGRSPSSGDSDQKLPFIIRGFCVNIQDLFSSPEGSRIYQFSRSLGLTQNDVKNLKDEIDFHQDLPSLFWAVIYEWNRRCNTVAVRATMLNQLLQACDDCRIPNPLDVKPMSTRDRLIIESNYSYLVENLLVRSLLVYLRDHQYLSSRIIDYVQEPGPESEKVFRLVDILPVCGHRALDILVVALRKSEQFHIADKIIESDEQRFAVATQVDCQSQTESTILHESKVQEKKKKKRLHLKNPFKRSKSYAVSQK